MYQGFITKSTEQVQMYYLINHETIQAENYNTSNFWWLFQAGQVKLDMKHDIVVMLCSHNTVSESQTNEFEIYAKLFLILILFFVYRNTRMGSYRLKRLQFTPCCPPLPSITTQSSESVPKKSQKWLPSAGSSESQFLTSIKII